jgi:hypothetical protein
MEVPGNGAGNPAPRPDVKPPLRDGHGGPGIAETLEAAGEDLRELLAQAKVLLGVRADRARMAARRRLASFAVAVVAGLAGVVILVQAASALVRGLSGGLSALFGGVVWLGQLATGVLIIGGALVGLRLLAARRERREFEKRKAKYEELHRNEERRRAAARAAADGGGAAGPGGAAGAEGDRGARRPAGG